MKKMSKITKTVTLLGAAIMLSISTNAQHKHKESKPDHDNAKSPHGGKVEEAGEYHAEVLVKDGKTYFYLLDGKAKAMSNKGVFGSVVLQYTDGTTNTVQLKANGSDGFIADDAKANSFSNAIVTFKVNGKTASAKFKTHIVSGAMYVCPMHPEVTSGKAEKCPKCGMALVKNKSKEHHHEHGEDGHKH